jgi:hypothetical protein
VQRHRLNKYVSCIHKSSLGLCIFFHPAFRLGPKRKEADSGVRPVDSRLPSIILEVGDTESLTQLKIDAGLWLEHMPEVSQIFLCRKTLLQILSGTAGHPGFN